MKKIFLLLFVLVIGVVGLSIVSAHVILNILWLQSLGIIQSIIKLIFIRWISIPLFAIVITLSSLFLLTKAERKNIKLLSFKLTTIFMFSLVAEYFLQISPAILNLILGGTLGVIDPLTNMDLSFYLLWLPLFKKCSIFFIGYTIMLLGFLFVSKKQFNILDKVLLLCGGFWIIVSLLIARFEFIHHHAHDYMGYMDIYGAFLPLVFSLLLLFVFLCCMIFIPNKKFLAISGGGILVIILFANTLYPWYLQKFVYTPNQSSLQEKFAGIHAESTRKSFDLQNISYTTQLKKDDLSTALSKNFWQDEEHFLKVIQQNQEVLPIFNIYSVHPILLSNDDGEMYPYLIAARESSENPNDLWDIKHFRNIFGYGAVMGAAHLFDNEGFSQLILKDLELNTNTLDLPIKNPHIFFSEHYEDYAFINTKMLLANFRIENYPLTEQHFDNIHSIPINFFTKVLLAIVYRDSRFFLTDYFLENSQFLYKRKPKQIVQALFPDFGYSEPALRYIDQELWWEMDVYTMSDLFYMSKSVETPWGYYNWLKAPMKVFVSAYSGEIVFDILEPNNPYVKITKRLYPRLFQKTLNIHHHNYPKDLFIVQSELLQTYHDTDAASYYSGLNKREIVSDDPYSYKIQDNHLTLQQTYNPAGKSIFSAQFTAFIDQNKQKKLFLYEAPASLGIPGEKQASAFLNQDTEFSRMSTLWGQVGSKISSSQMTFYPMEDRGIYAHTIFLESEQISTPLAAQFVVIDNTAISLGYTIDQLIYNALQRIGTTISVSERDIIQATIAEAYQYYLQAEQARINGNTKEYQENVDKIGVALQKITKE